MLKKSLDFAFRHVSNLFIFYITVEVCWRKRYVCIAYSSGNILERYLLVNVTFLYLAHFAQSISRAYGLEFIIASFCWPKVTITRFLSFDDYKTYINICTNHIFSV